MLSKTVSEIALLKAYSTLFLAREALASLAGAFAYTDGWVSTIVLS